MKVLFGRLVTADGKACQGQHKIRRSSYTAPTGRILVDTEFVSVELLKVKNMLKQ